MNKKLGITLTLAAGILWGFSGCCGQYIFDNYHADSIYLTAYRLVISGVFLVAFGFITDRENMINIFKKKKDVLRLFAFAVLGIMFNQLAYLTAISHSNSGTATILQYIGPVFVMIISCVMAHKLPDKKEVFAIIMAVLGTFIIATHGNINTMVITPAGLTWGLLAAIALTFYTLLPGNLLHDYGSIATTGYGMLLGGIILFTGSRAWNAPMIPETGCILAFIGIVVVGTVITFTLYLAGVKHIGPVKASMLASIEPVSATVIMVIWLNAPFEFMDFIGFMCIFVTIFLLTKKDRNEA